MEKIRNRFLEPRNDSQIEYSNNRLIFAWQNEEKKKIKSWKKKYMKVEIFTGGHNSRALPGIWTSKKTLKKN